MDLPEETAARLETQAGDFSATGISLVFHPLSPMIPSVHANLRYFEVEGGAWFGGGADLTPYYHFPEDTIHFHTTLKRACDRVDQTFYARFKQWCDEYFYIKHRGESRGVGGLFFDYLRGDSEKHFLFIQSVGNAFLAAYLPIVGKRLTMAWGDNERAWQLLRRGRYVEFNLIYDRGTTFGLETEGRVESILMSLPPLVRWNYNVQPPAGSREDDLLTILKNPREWISE